MAEVNEAKREKSQVEDINRSLYDFRYEEKDAYKVDAGLTPAIVEQISREKNDPDWMLELRLKSLEIYNKTGIPEWGPPIDELNMDDIITYVRPNTKMSAKWSEVPTDIKDTFEKLGIPQAERDSLAGVGAQYDSELVYHNVKKEVAEQGVIYTDLESAMRDRFGKTSLFVPEEDGAYFHFDVPVCVSPQFYGWVCGFGGKVEVTAPAEVRQGLREMVKKLAKMHQ